MGENIIFNGETYYPTKQGYYLRGGKGAMPKRLHIAIWESYYGKVPAGFHVHHIDHNKENNVIENLKLMDRIEHVSYHGNLQDKEKARRNMEINVRPKASIWHGSAEGRAWHKLHYEQMKCKFYIKIKIVCAECGIEFESQYKGDGKDRFCSNLCKHRHRLKSGIDDIRVPCARCGSEFIKNKYTKHKYCSKECMENGKRENRKNRKLAK